MALVPTSETTLPALPTSVGAARRFLVQMLEEWELQGLEYDASVVLSELVTNAVLHARTDVRVGVSYDDKVLKLEVSDGSPRLPVARRPNPQAATGKGLVLVEALASEWGVQRDETGKTIWASFADAASLDPSARTIRSLRPLRSSGGGQAARAKSARKFPRQARAAS